MNINHVINRMSWTNQEQQTPGIIYNYGMILSQKHSLKQISNKQVWLLDNDVEPDELAKSKLDPFSYRRAWGIAADLKVCQIGNHYQRIVRANNLKDDGLTFVEQEHFIEESANTRLQRHAQYALQQLIDKIRKKRRQRVKRLKADYIERRSYFLAGDY